MSKAKSLGPRARFMMIIGAGLLAIVICVVAFIGWFESANVEARLRATSVSELLSLNALVSSAWLVNHIRGSDQKYRSHLNAKGTV